MELLVIWLLFGIDWLLVILFRYLFVTVWPDSVAGVSQKGSHFCGKMFTATWSRCEFKEQRMYKCIILTFYAQWCLWVLLLLYFNNCKAIIFEKRMQQCYLLLLFISNYYLFWCCIWLIMVFLIHFSICLCSGAILLCMRLPLRATYLF